MLCRRGGRRWVRSGEAFTSKYIYKRRSGMQVGWCEDFSLQAKTPEPPPLVLVTHTHTHTLSTHTISTPTCTTCTFTSQKWTQADRPIKGGRRGENGQEIEANSGKPFRGIMGKRQNHVHSQSECPISSSQPIKTPPSQPNIH